MAWHAGIDVVRGGFARMTIFFVLSGFLATLSYRRVWKSGRSGAFRRFWSNRARRLLPVTLIGVATSIVYTLAWGSRDMITALPGDVASVFLYVSNWRFIESGRSYAELFERPSALQHYWTLSLEEQCFILLPVVLGVAGWLSRRRYLFGVAAVTGLAVVLGVLPLFTRPDPDTAYYGTHVRGSEFLVGVLAGLWLLRRGGSTTDDRTLPSIRFLGLGSLLLLAAVMLFLDRSESWLYQGGMALFALPAALTLLAALDPTTAVHRILRWAPIAMLGRWAFPIYVIHWPIFQYVDRQLDLPRTAELVVSFGAAIALGAALHRWYERPLMEAAHTPAERREAGQWLVPDRPLFTSVAVVTAVLMAAAFLPAGSPQSDVLDLATLPPDPFAPAADRPGPPPSQSSETPDHTVPVDAWAEEVTLANLAARSVTVETAPEILARGPSTPLPDSGSRADGMGRRFALYGGSTAFVYGFHLTEDLSEQVTWSPASARLGCGLLRDVRRRTTQRELPHKEVCDDWPLLWPAIAIEARTEVVGLMTGVWETYDIQLPDDSEWRSVLEPSVEEALRSELARAHQSFVDAGVSLLVLFTTPQVTDGAAGDSRLDRGLPDDHDLRVERYNVILSSFATEHPDVTVVDYGRFIDESSEEQRNQWLNDGVHPTSESSDLLLEEYLVPSIEDAVRGCATCPWS